MSRPLVFVGEAPGRYGNQEEYARHQPLYPYPQHSAGWRLWNMTGLTRMEYLRIRRINLCPATEFPWNRRPTAREAREAADAIISSRRFEDCNLVLLGRVVQAAFCRYNGPADLPQMEWLRLMLPWGHPLGRTYTGIMVALVPHPSGRSRWWNDPENRRAGETWLRSTVAAHGHEIAYPPSWEREERVSA